MLNHFELHDKDISELLRVPDPKPYNHEGLIQTGYYREISPARLKELSYLDYPMVGPCITAIIYRSREDVVYAMHIAPEDEPDYVQAQVQAFLDRHSDKDNWKLEFLVRQNKSSNSSQGSDSAKGNLANLNRLADLDDLIPGRLSVTEATYVKTSTGVDNFAWNFENHFFVLTHDKK